MKTNWLADGFRYLYEVVVEADKPIFMFSMVLLPFIAPLLPALITAQNLQKYMEFPTEWTWIGVVAFELVAMLSQMASVSANMKLVDDPHNPALISEARRTGLSYGIYIATLIASNAILEFVNHVSFSQVLVTACLTVGLSFSASLINATRIYNRDRDDRDEYNRQSLQEHEDLIRREKAQEKLERLRIKQGKFQESSNPSGNLVESSRKVPEDLESSKKVPNFDWRKMKNALTREELIVMANWSPAQMDDMGKKTGYTYKTMSNWRANARQELGLEKDDEA